VGTNVEHSADDGWTVVQGKTKRKIATEMNTKKTQVPVKGKRLENSGCEQHFKIILWFTTIKPPSVIYTLVLLF
jgi:hypothetical protein